MGDSKSLDAAGESSITLYALWKQLPGRRSKRNQARSALEQLRDLLLRLNEDWQSYCTFQSEPQILWINNSTEQAIGRMKMRARTVRVYKLGMVWNLACYWLALTPLSSNRVK